MARYAAGTEVSSIKSRMEIEQTLARYGANQFIYGLTEDRAVIGFRMKDRQVKFVLPMPRRDAAEFNFYKQGQKTFQRTETAVAERYEQAVRQRWRALALVVKAKLEAVEAGISVFEDEFMAHIVLPSGATVGEVMRPQIAIAYQRGEMPPLLGYAGTQQ